MRSLVLSIGLLLATPALADEPLLEVSIGGQTRSYSRNTLLTMPETSAIHVGKDMTYGIPMVYRAVPVASLLEGMRLPPSSVIEAVSEDGFAAQLPLDLLLNTDPEKVVAWLAIESEDRPWPPIPGKDESAGPFYIVWVGPDAASIRSEQWPYQVSKLSSQPPVEDRWPALSVDARLSATDPIRTGQAVFVTQCLPCHKLNGAGSSDVGPDLNRPMNPTQYFTPEGLHALIRDPKSVRTWPAQQMPGFPPDRISDREVDLLIAYLRHMASRKAPQ